MLVGSDTLLTNIHDPDHSPGWSYSPCLPAAHSLLQAGPPQGQAGRDGGGPSYWRSERGGAAGPAGTDLT